MPENTRSPAREHDLEWLLTGVVIGDTRPLPERVRIVSAALLLVSGLEGTRGVKTAEIARRAGTTESTLFRHFASQEEIFESIVEWGWSRINEAIANAAFDHPETLSHEKKIVRDAAALIAMYASPEERIAASVALSTWQRRTNAEPMPLPLERYMRRLTTLCTSVLSDAGEETQERDAGHAALYLTAYIASVWQTWLTIDFSPHPAGHFLGPEFCLKSIQMQLDLMRRTGSSASGPSSSAGAWTRFVRSQAELARSNPSDIAEHRAANLYIV